MALGTSEHKIQCSYRILIGPWDEKAPLPFHQPHETEHSTATGSNSSTNNSSVGGRPALSTVQPISKNSDHKHASASGNTYITANSVFPQQHHEEEEEEEGQANSDDLAAQIDDDHCATSHTSTDTIRPAKSSTSATSIVDRKKRKSAISKKERQTLNKSLLWRESGPVFVPRLPPHVTTAEDGAYSKDTVIKHDVLLCTRIQNTGNENIPTTYKVKAARRLKRQDDWHQLEVILTPATLECYDSMGLLWPKRSLRHRIPLNDQHKTRLCLYMLSPLDYTFCLQYIPEGAKTSDTVIFRARSYTLCQEWYVAIYQLLPGVAKRPFPNECEVYVPCIKLRVHLPLITNNDTDQEAGRKDMRYRINTDHVKDAVLTLLESEPLWQNFLRQQVTSPLNLSLCWTRKDRTEWIFWKQAVNEQDNRADMVIGPQSIENTHQLELRPVQHTPCEVVLNEDVTLKEPLPCEGFLTKVTDFEGHTLKPNAWSAKRFYFSSFGGFLFVTPAHKAKIPDHHTYINPVILKEHKHQEQSQNHDIRQSYFGYKTKRNPFVILLSPFVGNTDQLLHPWQQGELQRRVELITDAVGYINLSEVSHVHRVFDSNSSSDGFFSNHQQRGNVSYGSITSSFATTSTSPILENGPSSSSTSLSASSPSQHPDATESTRYKNQFKPRLELVMKNGLRLKFETFSSDTCDQWVSCLSDLIIYTKARLEADRDVHSQTGFTSVMDSKFKLQTVADKETDATSTLTDRLSVCYDTQTASKHSFVDTRLWSFCLFSHCHDIAKSGVMYVRSKGIFSQKQFILTVDGRLHYFNIYKRSGDDGKPLRTAIHDRKGILDMANAYVYSGMASCLDGTLSKTQLDRPPRLFDNGMTSNDPDEDCLLTVWIPKRRRVFSPRRQCVVAYGSDRRFNSTGKGWLFLTPSRQEKEEWVWAISVIQEALLREAVRSRQVQSPTNSMASSSSTASTRRHHIH